MGYIQGFGYINMPPLFGVRASGGALLSPMPERLPFRSILDYLFVCSVLEYDPGPLLVLRKRTCVALLNPFLSFRSITSGRLIHHGRQ